MTTALDHLVIAAHTLEQGAAWCQATLGVVPGPGGRHAFMATHNRLLRIDSAGFAQAYLEIIAIDPEAPPPGRPRWFGLDEPALQARLRQAPRLLHAVLRTPHIEMLRWGLVNVGVQPGEPMAAERDTPAGLLRWRILLRDDGAIALNGALPTLIEWGAVHPTANLPASPLALRSATVAGLPERVRQVLRPRGWTVAEAGPALQVVLDTPLGAVTLCTGDANANANPAIA